MVYTSWRYRARIGVANPTSISDYQINVIVPYRVHMKSDFSDIRFSDVNGNELSYWIESSTSFVSANVWIKCPSNCDKFYLYYGNSITSASNGINTFVLYNGYTTTSFISTLSITTPGYIFENLVNRPAITQANTPNFGFGDSSSGRPTNSIFIEPYDGYSGHWYYDAVKKDGVVNPEFVDTPTYTASSIMRFKLEFISLTLVNCYRDNVKLGYSITSGIPTAAMGLYAAAGDGLISYWSFIRKYIANEPIATVFETHINPFHRRYNTQLITIYTKNLFY